MCLHRGMRRLVGALRSAVPPRQGGRLRGGREGRGELALAAVDVLGHGLERFDSQSFRRQRGKRETGAAPGRFRRRLLMSLYVSTDIVFSLLFCLDSVQTFGASNCYGSKHVIGDSREYCNWLNFGSELAILEMKEEIY